MTCSVTPGSMGWTSPADYKEREKSRVSSATPQRLPQGFYQPLEPPSTPAEPQVETPAPSRLLPGQLNHRSPGALAAAQALGPPDGEEADPGESSPALPRAGQGEPGAAPPTCRPPPLCPPAAGTSPARPEPRALPARPRFPLRSFPRPSRGRAGPGRAGERRQLRQRHRLRAPGHGGLSTGKVPGFPRLHPPTPSRARPLLPPSPRGCPRALRVIAV